MNSDGAAQCRWLVPKAMDKRAIVEQRPWGDRTASTTPKDHPTLAKRYEKRFSLSQMDSDSAVEDERRAVCRPGAGHSPAWERALRLHSRPGRRASMAIEEVSPPLLVRGRSLVELVSCRNLRKSVSVLDALDRFETYKKVVQSMLKGRGPERN